MKFLNHWFRSLAARNDRDRIADAFGRRGFLYLCLAIFALGVAGGFQLIPAVQTDRTSAGSSLIRQARPAAESSAAFGAVAAAADPEGGAARQVASAAVPVQVSAATQAAPVAALATQPVVAQPIVALPATRPSALRSAAADAEMLPTISAAANTLSPAAVSVASAPMPATAHSEAVQPLAGLPAAPPTDFETSMVPQGLRERVLTELPVRAPLVALTFDDGPSPQSTRQIMDILESRGANATFFLIGRNVRAYPSLAAEIASRGFEVANHSQEHPDLSRLANGKAVEQIAACDESIRSALGADYPLRLVRFPYGASNGALRQGVTQRGELMVGWSIDTEDWKKGATTASLIGRVEKGLAPGAIILMHDRTRPTAQSLEAMLDHLTSRGYRAVSVGQLIASAWGSPTVTASAR